MGKKHFSEEQIAFALRQAESGTALADLDQRMPTREQPASVAIEAEKALALMDRIETV